MSDVFAYCSVSISPVRSNSSDTSEMVTQLLFGELVTVLEQTEKWWKIQSYADNYVGWIDPKQVNRLSKKEVNRWLDGLHYQRSQIRKLSSSSGVLTTVKGSFVPFHVESSFMIGDEEYAFIDEQELFSATNAFSIAEEYLNAPYLWGGKSPFGIDCSALVQATFRFLDVNLPRDASQQVDYGATIEFGDHACGDVAFFHNEHDKIIHVGILNEKNEIIHASGTVRIDNFDATGIIHAKKGYKTHSLNCIKRMI